MAQPGGTRHAKRRNGMTTTQEEGVLIASTGELDDVKVSSPVRRGAAETEPGSHRADRPPYLTRTGQGVIFSELFGVLTW